MTTTGVVTTDHIFIYAPADKGYDHIYKFLSSADFRKAYDKKESKDLFNIGLEAVSWVLEQKLRDNRPDIIYMETSLFPERTRINHKIVDFLSVRINEDLPPEEKDELLDNLFRQYKLIYNALHETQNTVYFVPEFIQRPAAMQMLFTEYSDSTDYAGSPADKLRVERKMDEINRSIERIENTTTVKDGLADRGKAKLRGWALDEVNNLYVTRDFLTRETQGQTRKESKDDLEINAHIFHKLFHERAFRDYAKTFLWCIPIVGAGEKGSRRLRTAPTLAAEDEKYLVGQGALFVLLAYKSGDVALNNPESLATDIARTVSYVLKDYFISYLYTSTSEMVDEVINRSLRAAAGAIMSRNISHNIGSHVAPRTTISAIEERLDSFRQRA